MLEVSDFVKECERFVAVRRHKMGKRLPRALHYTEGWSYLGSGHFGEAWERRDYPGLVLKISGRAGWGSGAAHHSSDEDRGRDALDAWPVFARHCMAHPHKHLPTVLHLQELSLGMTWGVLRRLENGDTRRLVTAEFRSTVQAAMAHIGECPPWLRAILQMQDALKLEADVHSGNTMWDAEAGCPVLTDPFSFKWEE